MKIYLNDKDGKRKVVEAELVKDRELSVLVRLAYGNIISRNKKRDLA
jgi:hypothetical protein